MKIENYKLKITINAIVAVFSFLFLFFNFSVASAATLSLSPSAGTFVVGSTFDVAVLLNTEGETINALEIDLAFPADKLQIISPSTGLSIVGIWTVPPSFDNTAGRVSLQGGIPGGIRADRALVTTITFRVKSVGKISLRFLDDSKVLLHDGRGTDALRNTISGVYELILPPPAGPLVSSATHPDSGVWYPNPNISLQWTNEFDADGYSFVLDKEPVSLPDDISDSQKNSVLYNNVGDGINYFHIKALRGGRWGGVTHFSIQIDTSPPAEFSIKIIPSPKTTRRQPVLQFLTTDAFLGVDHYELKIVPLQGNFEVGATNQSFFVEAQSPYVLPELGIGAYDVIVRAYDKAGNYREEIERLRIVNAVFSVVEEKGLEIKNVIFIPWIWFWAIALFLVVILVFVAKRIRALHHVAHLQKEQGELPENIKKQIEELKEYRKKYGSSLVVLLFLLSTFYFLFSASGLAFAQQQELSPPIITTFSRNVSNQEIFYIGGKTESPKTDIVIYLQNVQTGETAGLQASSDNRGDWFYRHDRFLVSGNYILWAQSKIGEELSPPTPQFKIEVFPVALQFGASRLSYTFIYLILIILLAVISIVLIWYIIFHSYHAKKKQQLIAKEIKEAEESVKRGFAVLRRDIQAELTAVKKLKLTSQFSQEEEKAAAQLLQDLEKVERYIGKEVWDVEKEM